MDDFFRSINTLLRSSDGAPEVKEALVLAAWKRAVGEGMRWNAVPCRLSGKILIVAVPDSGWQKQLENMGAQLLFRLNSVIGKPTVKFIEFRVDAETVEKERAQLQLTRKRAKEDTERILEKTKGDVQSAAAEIEDENLRRQFLLAAGACLDRSGK